MAKETKFSFSQNLYAYYKEKNFVFIFSCSFVTAYSFAQLDNGKSKELLELGAVWVFVPRVHFIQHDKF